MRVGVLFAVILSATLYGSHSYAAICDADTDGDIDRLDLDAIIAARNAPATGADDPRDANGDGWITALDARACVLRCTLPRCAIVEPHPVYEFDTNYQQTQTLPPSGGAVRLEDPVGATYTLKVPEGAIGADTQFTLTRVASITGLPVGLTPIAAVRLQPSGLDFIKKTTVTVELPPSARSGRPTIAFTSNDDGANLTFLPLRGTNPTAAALEDLVVSIDVPHFTPIGVAEVDPGTTLPPPPANASAWARAQYAIAVHHQEIMNAGGVIGADDPVTFQILMDWFENPVDGLRVRAQALAISPDGSDLTSLLRLSSEMNTLVEDAGYFLEAEGFGGTVVAAVVEAMQEVVASYLVELRDMCNAETLSVQQRLDLLRIDVVDSFIAGDLRQAFEDEVFACRYEVTFTPDFQAAVVGDSVEIEYVIALEDGTLYSDGLDALSVEYSLGAHQLAVESVSPTTIAATPTAIGLGSLSLTVGAGPEAVAEVLAVPSFIAMYQLSGSGSQSGCIEPDDNGPGGGSIPMRFDVQQLLSADRSGATIGISGAGFGAGTPLNNVDLTVNLTSFGSGTATGAVFGGASYAYSYEDVDDQGDPIIVSVSGSGSVTGTVTATMTGNSFGIQFSGSDNWCSNVSGVGTIVSAP